MHFPGFVTVYKDNEQKVHLYFYRGIKDDSPIYKKLDLSQVKEKYKFKLLPDGAIDYIFDNSNIKSIGCKLVEQHTGKIVWKHFEIY